MKNICWSIRVAGLLVFACGLNTARAQTGLYVQAALNATNLTGTGYSAFQKAGIYASFGRSEDLDWLKGGLVQYGLAFSQKGARKAPNPEKGDFDEYNIRLNYAEVPFSFFFRLKGIKGQLGLSAGYLISKTETSRNGVAPPVPTKYNKLDFMASAGFAVPLGDKVLLGLKGSMSIFPVVPLTGATSIAFSRASRNQVISLGITYVFVKKTEPDSEGE